MSPAAIADVDVDADVDVYVVVDADVVVASSLDDVEHLNRTEKASVWALLHAFPASRHSLNRLLTFVSLSLITQSDRDSKSPASVLLCQ